jgi:hypothetical protein
MSKSVEQAVAVFLGKPEVDWEKLKPFSEMARLVARVV